MYSYIYSYLYIYLYINIPLVYSVHWPQQDIQLLQPDGKGRGRFLGSHGTAQGIYRPPLLPIIGSVKYIYHSCQKYKNIV